MFYSNNSKTFSRLLFSLALAALLCTSVVARVTSSSPPETPAGVAHTNTAGSLSRPQATVLKTNGKIAFVSSRDGNNEIYTMNSDGSSQTNITNNAASDSLPAFSPDGSKIAFISNRELGVPQVFVMGSDGVNVTRVTSGSLSPGRPCWSPDGTRIMFAGGQPTDIFVINADGNGLTNITNTSSASESLPAWAPNGSRVAFNRSITSSFGIYLMNSDGSNIRSLLAPSFAVNSAWSPDSAHLAFSSLTGIFDPPLVLVADIFVIDADGNNIRALTSGSSKVSSNSPAWSPDGAQIAFARSVSISTNQSSSEISVRTVDGSSQIQLTNTGNNSAPSWQPLPGGSAGCANPADCAEFFVSQHYRDFLNREPDPPGLAFWIDTINQCGFDQQCSEAKRINASAAFFLSIEFQQTGYLVYRMYKASYGNLPGAPVPIKLSEFLPDTQQIGQGVVVNQAGWEQVLESNKQSFASQLVERTRFTSAFPGSLTPAQFVDALFANAGVTPSTIDRASIIGEFGSAATTADVAARARVLRRVAEDATFAQQEFNRAFVLMEYFGYLRRNPNDAPEPGLNFAGYNFWLTKLEQFNGNFVQAEMVKAFINSGEYRQRFGQP